MGIGDDDVLVILLALQDTDQAGARRQRMYLDNVVFVLLAGNHHCDILLILTRLRYQGYIAKLTQPRQIKLPVMINLLQAEDIGIRRFNLFEN